MLSLGPGSRRSIRRRNRGAEMATGWSSLYRVAADFVVADEEAELWMPRSMLMLLIAYVDGVLRHGEGSKIVAAPPHAFGSRKERFRRRPRAENAVVNHRPC